MDKGTQFIALVFVNVCAVLATRRVHINTYHLQSTPKEERNNIYIPIHLRSQERLWHFRRTPHLSMKLQSPQYQQPVTLFLLLTRPFGSIMERTYTANGTDIIGHPSTFKLQMRVRNRLRRILWAADDRPRLAQYTYEKYKDKHFCVTKIFQTGSMIFQDSQRETRTRNGQGKWLKYHIIEPLSKI